MNNNQMNVKCRYTLGGFYLARYDDSPVGAFEEVRMLKLYTYS